ncbi:hypothetical protein NEUTE2DRAFT_127182 [Neurospora tetrasperma FGSC 2509]|nr:hypothetical protein NEUTE2DRAFT_127182 [Neurospora tetrasperma FGSC 2509]
MPRPTFGYGPQGHSFDPISRASTTEFSSHCYGRAVRASPGHSPMDAGARERGRVKTLDGDMVDAEGLEG